VGAADDVTDDAADEAGVGAADDCAVSELAPPHALSPKTRIAGVAIRVG
jgi:hypothetical protein